MIHLIFLYREMYLCYHEYILPEMNPDFTHIKLPRLLVKEYKNSDFSLRLKAKFVYYLSLSFLLVSTLIGIYDVIVHVVVGLDNDSLSQILIIQMILTFLILASIITLVKGRVHLSANLLLLFSFTAVWTIMIYDRGNDIGRIDTMFFLYALFGMIPIALSKKLMPIVLYLFINIVFLIVYSEFIATDMFSDPAVQLEFLGDAILGLVLSAAIIYSIHRIDYISKEKIKRDYEEKLSAQEKLVASETKFSELTDLLPLAIFEMDLAGNISYVNRRALEVFGYRGEYIPGSKNILNMVVESEYGQIRKNMLRSMRSPQTEGIVYTGMRSDGSTFPARIFSTPIREQGKVCGMRGAIEDITQQRKTQQELIDYQDNLENQVKIRTQELEHTNRELMDANEELHAQKETLQKALDDLHRAQNQLVESEKMVSLGILASGVAHEINNPLNFIQGSVYGLQQGDEKDKPLPRDFVNPLIGKIQEGVDRIVAIVSSLNHFNRQTPSFDEECFIHDILDNCLIILENKTKHRISIRRKYSQEQLAIRGNEGKLHQVFLNIISNSVQAIQGQGEIILETALRNDKVEISISDNGAGMSQETLKNAINPFFTTKDPGEGTGLGLAISYNIITDHQGSMKITSHIKEGTLVRISLPKNQSA